MSKAGISLTKLDHFLEENAYRLSDRRGMSEFLSDERKCIRDEITANMFPSYLMVQVGLASLWSYVVVRFLDDWDIKQRLFHMQTLVKYMMGAVLGSYEESYLSGRSGSATLQEYVA